MEHLTVKAAEALKACDVIVGYDTYINLIRPLIDGKEVISTGMMREVERCRAALDAAIDGKITVLVSSGDPGIYGMAGLVFELLRAEELKFNDEKKAGRIRRTDYKLKIEVVPGVPAFAAAASLLGAPLMHDFASVSLSDLLTPLELIFKRVEAAAKADFVIMLYNPKSKKRVEHLVDAVRIVSDIRVPQTPVGIVKNGTREGESVILTTLEGLPDYYDMVDMTTIVIIGNKSTLIYNGRMITPRGYKKIG